MSTLVQVAIALVQGMRLKEPSPLSTLVQVAIALVEGMQLNFVCPDEQLCLFKLHFGEVLIKF